MPDATRGQYTRTIQQAFTVDRWRIQRHADPGMCTPILARLLYACGCDITGPEQGDPDHYPDSIYIACPDHGRGFMLGGDARHPAPGTCGGAALDAHVFGREP